jgi:intracellular multiplication protein IcmJ
VVNARPASAAARTAAVAPAPRLLRLVPRASRATWRSEGLGGPARAAADPAFAEARRVANTRDGFACRYCGFAPGAEWIEVDHLDDDHDNNDLSNLASACRACHLLHHLGHAGAAGEAVLIWLPELTQPALNHIARALHAAMRAGGLDPANPAARPGPNAPVFAVAAARVWIEISSRRSDAARRLGSSDPTDLGEALIALDANERARIPQMLAGLRLLPKAAWAGGPAGEDIYFRMLDSWLSPGGSFSTPGPDDWDLYFARRWREFEAVKAASNAQPGASRTRASGVPA